MFDTIRGPVTEIIDGDTFDMKVTHRGKHNKFKYGPKERVRIENINEPELDTHAGQRSKDLLERKLLGKEIRCYIQARDTYRRLVSRVILINN